MATRVKRLPTKKKKPTKGKKKPLPKKADPRPIASADPRVTLAGEFADKAELDLWLAGLVEQLADAALEYFEPLPDGLTERQKETLLRQKAALRVHLSSVEGIAWGALVALRRSRKLSQADFVAAHQALLTVTASPRAAEAADG